MVKSEATPAKTRRRSSNVVLLLGERRRRWLNIKTTLGERLWFAVDIEEVNVRIQSSVEQDRVPSVENTVQDLQLLQY